MFLSKGIKMSKEDLRRCMRENNESDEEYLVRLSNYGYGKNHKISLLWVGGVLLFTYVVFKGK